MKTPLPRKYTAPFTPEERDHNQFVDYLAELTTVVEGKQANGASGKPYVFPHQVGEQSLAKSVPTLKETLLREIAELPDYGIAGQSFTIKRSDVEAIINRLMP